MTDVGGRPLVAWTISAAHGANNTDRVVVTTDAEAIANMARECGAEVPFLRPVELAQDDTPGIVPILHAVRWLEQYEKYQSEIVVCLQPTSPLRTAGDIDAVIRLAREKKADAVVSVTPVIHHPFWMKQIDAEGHVSDFLLLEKPITRRQDLPPVYALNGAIYLAHREVLLEHQSWYTDHTYAYVMPPERSLDIDTPWDLYLADLILRDQLRHESD